MPINDLSSRLLAAVPRLEAAGWSVVSFKCADEETWRDLPRGIEVGQFLIVPAGIEAVMVEAPPGVLAVVAAVADFRPACACVYVFPFPALEDLGLVCSRRDHPENSGCVECEHECDEKCGVVQKEVVH